MAKKKQIELTIEEKLQNALVPKEEQPYKIPSNWCWVRLGNITQIKGGKRIPKGTSLLKENTGRALVSSIINVSFSNSIFGMIATPYS